MGPTKPHTKTLLILLSVATGQSACLRRSFSNSYLMFAAHGQSGIDAKLKSDSGSNHDIIVKRQEDFDLH
jgi:hypothetical protein